MPTLPFDLGQVLHQPVDGVVGVGGVVDLAGVERAAQRARHHVLAFGAVLAAHVLEHADIAAAHEHLITLRQFGIHMRRFEARGAAVGVIRRARQQDGGMLGALGNHDDRMQLHAVAHRDHHFALDVVVARRRRSQRALRNIRRQWCGLGQGEAGRECGGQGSDGEQGTADAHETSGRAGRCHDRPGLGWKDDRGVAAVDFKRPAAVLPP